MKKVIGTVVFFFIAMTFGAGISASLFGSICGGGAAESFLYPIYGGIVLLAGLIVLCTVLILDEINALKEKFDQNQTAQKTGREEE